MQRPRHTSRPASTEIAEAIGAELRARGLRSTAARRFILTALREVPDHPTVDELSTLLEARGHDIGIATVYQNLARLAEASLVTRFLDSQGLLRFDANPSRHHHLLCRSCGRVVDVDMDELGAKRLSQVAHDLATENASWELEDAQLELRGLCPTCRAAR
jgi:Fur family transcriptional regulator, peroxide stress response regulator